MGWIAKVMELTKIVETVTGVSARFCYTHLCPYSEKGISKND